MVHGLPQKPQGQGVPGPSRPPAQQQYQARQPQQPQYQQQQPQQPCYPQTNGYYPYAQAAAYNPYAAYYQQAAQYNYAYNYQPTATPEGYSYSATYQAAQPTHSEPPNKRSRPNGPPASVAPAISVKPWRNCSHPGCKYVGSGENVEIHEGDRHLIFPNGRPVERSEEEEKWASHKGPPPPIEGTGIVLQTDEDIAKWIAERKSKWPSAKRLAERDAEREAAIARGENPDRGRGRGRGGANGGKRNNPAAAAEDWGRPAPEENGGQSSRGGMRGRGQERGRGRGRGRGREERNTGRRQDMSGEETKPTTAAAPQVETPVAEATTARSNTAAGIVEYNSNESADGVDSDSDSSSDSSSSSDEDDETAKPAPKTIPAPASKPDRPICKFFAKTGRCKMGQKCRFAHTTDGKPHVQENNTNTRAPGAKAKQVPAKKVNPFERPSMLGALLANPIQNTLSQLTQTIRFLVANDMLQGVELNPGEAEEQTKEKNRIEVVEAGDVKMVEEVDGDETAEASVEIDPTVE